MRTLVNLQEWEAVMRRIIGMVPKKDGKLGQDPTGQNLLTGKPIAEIDALLDYRVTRGRLLALLEDLDRRSACSAVHTSC